MKLWSRFVALPLSLLLDVCIACQLHFISEENKIVLKSEINKSSTCELTLSYLRDWVDLADRRYWEELSTPLCSRCLLRSPPGPHRPFLIHSENSFEKLILVTLKPQDEELTCSEFKLSGSEMLPPSKNFGIRTFLLARFSGRKNFDTPVTLNDVGRSLFALLFFNNVGFSFSCLLILISRFSTSIIAFICVANRFDECLAKCLR